MADKAISQLNAATSVTSVDLFVLEQSGEAKKLPGQILENWLVSFADGHGGIQDIEKTGSSGTNPVVDTYTIYLADETTKTFQVVNGVKGDTGDQTYVWIRYAAHYPTSDSDMGTSPDAWIGIYTGLSSTAPTHYTEYSWYEFKGETGETGAAATITAATIGYQQSDSGSVVPEGSWTTTVPTPVAGKFLWTRIQIQFNTGSPITAYSVARYGIDGSGAVVSVNGVSPDANGNVQLLAADIQTLDSQSVQAHLDDIEDDVDALKTSLSTVKSDLGIVEDTNTATHTIAQGQYVIWKDALYTASQAIPLGTTLSSSNLTAVSDGGFNALQIERGSNAYGDYTKFPDGTLIQWGTVTFSNVAAATVDNTTVTFPIPFVGVPFGVANADESTRPDLYPCNVRPYASDFTKTRIYTRNGYSSALTYDVSWLCIGRWK